MEISQDSSSHIQIKTFSEKISRISPMLIFKKTHEFNRVIKKNYLKDLKEISSYKKLPCKFGVSIADQFSRNPKKTIDNFIKTLSESKLNCDSFSMDHLSSPRYDFPYYKLINSLAGFFNLERIKLTFYFDSSTFGNKFLNSVRSSTKNLNLKSFVLKISIKQRNEQNNTNRILQTLTNFRVLTKLTLDFQHKIRPEELKTLKLSIKTLTRLKKLKMNISFDDTTDYIVIISLISALKKMKSEPEFNLIVDRYPHNIMVFIEELGKLRGLKKISLTEMLFQNDTYIKGLSHLTKLLNLESLSLSIWLKRNSKEDIVSQLSAIKALKKLRYLHLSIANDKNSDFTNFDIVDKNSLISEFSLKFQQSGVMKKLYDSTAAQIRNMKHLETFSFEQSHNLIKDALDSKICEALRTCSKLKKFKFVSEYTYSDLSTFISETANKLEELRMNFTNGRQFGGLGDIAASIQNSKIKKLILNFEKTQFKSGSKLKQFCSALSSLNLLEDFRVTFKSSYNCLINPQNVNILFESLNTINLKKFYLDLTGFDTFKVNGPLLFEKLSHNIFLEEVVLDFKIYLLDNGCKSLSKFLKNCTQLKKLHLNLADYGKSVTKEEFFEFASNLRVSRMLEDFALKLNKLTLIYEEDIVFLGESLRSLPLLQIVTIKIRRCKNLKYKNTKRCLVFLLKDIENCKIIDQMVDEMVLNRML